MNNNCQEKNCGCKDTYLTTPPPCPTPEDCPERQPCSEVFDAACIIYTGPDLECGEDVVVTQNSSVTTALEDVIGYFCDLASQVPVTIVEAGDGIEVTPTTVGTTTTYTVSAVPTVIKYVKEFDGIVFDNETITIPRSEMVDCRLLSNSCGLDGNEIADFTYSIHYLLVDPITPANNTWVSIGNENGVSVRTNNTSGDISIELGINPIDPPVRLRVVIVG